jgi:hypothetical protein
MHSDRHYALDTRCGMQEENSEFILMNILGDFNDTRGPDRWIEAYSSQRVHLDTDHDDGNGVSESFASALSKARRGAK